MKGLMKKLYVILSRRKTCFYAIYHSGLFFTWLWAALRNRRVNKEIIFCFTVQEEDQFLCKISYSLFTSFACFYVVMACILSGPSVKQEVNNEFYNYALFRKKTC